MCLTMIVRLSLLHGCTIFYPPLIVYHVDSCDFLLCDFYYVSTPPQTVVLPYVKLFKDLINQEIITPPSPPNRPNSEYYNQASSKS